MRDFEIISGLSGDPLSQMKRLMKAQITNIIAPNARKKRDTRMKTMSQEVTRHHEQISATQNQFLSQFKESAKGDWVIAAEEEMNQVKKQLAAIEAIRLLSSKNFSPDIITNSVNLLYEFSNTNLSIISTGGKLNNHSGTLVGAQSIETIKNYYTEAAILSCNAMSADGFTVGGEEEGLTKKRMIEQSNYVIMLVDSTKISVDVNSYFKFSDYNDIDLIVTDETILPEEIQEKVNSNTVKVI